MKRLIFPLASVLIATCSVMRADAVRAHNFAAELTVSEVRIAQSYGSNRASAGKQFVILAATWEDIIDPKLAGERDLPLAYGVPELGQHLYLIVDGKELGALRGDWSDGGSRKSFSGLTLTKPGDKAQGDLVFEIGAGPATDLALRFYDDTAGDFGAHVRGVSPDSQPILPIQKNAVSEFGVFEVKDSVPCKDLPPGFRAVEVDLRARSVWKHDVAATGFDPAHQAGENVSRPNLLDWTEPPKYLHVLTEGDYAYPATGDSVPDSVRFIPEFFTGFHAKFFIPTAAQTLRLICAMPHAATDAETLDLAPLVFDLPTKQKSDRTSIVPDGNPLLSIQDEMFSVDLTNVSSAKKFAGVSVGDDQQFLVLDFSVRNNGKTGEFFQPVEQLFAVAADGTEIGVDDVTWQGTHRPETQIHFPAGAHRQFEVVFRVPKDGATKLSFHGGEFQKTYDLPALPAHVP
ncbi:MAG TPA: hypothetical protein VIM69_05455 [Opitutaceae bacterium]